MQQAPLAILQLGILPFAGTGHTPASLIGLAIIPLKAEPHIGLARILAHQLARILDGQ